LELVPLVLDTVGPGGQAGSSARIENYAGFPSGLSGNELALRSYVQALKFGAHFSAPHTIDSVRCAENGLHEVHTSEGVVVKTKTIIVATGVSYRNLEVDGLKRLQGNGVYYAATQVEAVWCENRPIHIIGAGNSAGQASMYLSKFTDQVNLIVRGGNIEKTMSSYLSERVHKNPRVKIRFRHELREVEGDHTLDKVHLENTMTGEKTIEDSCGVFIFIGATPCSDFLGNDVLKDKRGFIMTGNQVVEAGKWPLSDRQPQPLETSCPGIFVAGDCRSETTKRVAFAIGDGALAVTCVHNVLGTYR
jgi:thioredoxin reductase (NADPH)